MKSKPNIGKHLFHHVRDKYRHYNYETTFDKILSDFREGKLGKVTLDNINFDWLNIYVKNIL